MINFISMLDMGRLTTNRINTWNMVQGDFHLSKLFLSLTFRNTKDLLECVQYNKYNVLTVMSEFKNVKTSPALFHK